jgi:hypothetical protein
MFSKVLSRNAISVLGFVLALSLCIGLPGAIAQEEPDPCEGQGDGCIYGCPDDADFTMDFRLEDCKFKDKGENPYFILKPGYRLVLETEDGAERSVETVLRDKKKIYLDGRKIKTRVVEERALEANEDEALVVVEVSRNYFAICKQTNAVYYFGEFSQDCDLEETGGFDPDNERRCADGSMPDTAGSWEAGVDGAMPGLIMPGTALNGARYFQEIAEAQEAVDRGEITATGLEPVYVPAGNFSGCIEINDTNPSEGVCGVGEDVKIYCPGVGLVADQELELVSYGFGDDDDDDDDNDDDDDDDDDDKKKKKKRHKKW